MQGRVNGVPLCDDARLRDRSLGTPACEGKERESRPIRGRGRGDKRGRGRGYDPDFRGRGRGNYGGHTDNKDRDDEKDDMLFDGEEEIYSVHDFQLPPSSDLLTMLPGVAPVASGRRIKWKNTKKLEDLKKGIAIHGKNWNSMRNDSSLNLSDCL